MVIWVPPVAHMRGEKRAFVSTVQSCNWATLKSKTTRSPNQSYAEGRVKFEEDEEGVLAFQVLRPVAPALPSRWHFVQHPVYHLHHHPPGRQAGRHGRGVKEGRGAVAALPCATPPFGAIPCGDRRDAGLWTDRGECCCCSWGLEFLLPSRVATQKKQRFFREPKTKTWAVWDGMCPFALWGDGHGEETRRVLSHLVRGSVGMRGVSSLFLLWSSAFHCWAGGLDSFRCNSHQSDHFIQCRVVTDIHPPAESHGSAHTICLESAVCAAVVRLYDDANELSDLQCLPFADLEVTPKPTSAFGESCHVSSAFCILTSVDVKT